MNFSKYLLSLQEGYDESTNEDIGMPVDESGFDFGVDKTNLPEEEGFEAARTAAEKFATATDGKKEDVDIDLSIDLSMPKDVSGFSESSIEDDECEMDCVDPATIPAVPAEEDQFSDDGDEGEGGSTPSDAELAANDDVVVDDESIEESATDWNDLF